MLLHDFPEFLCDYHFSFCDVIPPNCIQMRNLILSAFPRNMRLPDPFTPNLKVWLKGCLQKLLWRLTGCEKKTPFINWASEQFRIKPATICVHFSLFLWQVDLLTDIAHSPRILTNFASAIQPASFKKVSWLNDYLYSAHCTGRNIWLSSFSFFFFFFFPILFYFAGSWLVSEDTRASDILDRAQVSFAGSLKWPYSLVEISVRV